MSQRGKIGRLVAHGEGEGMFAFDPNVPKVDIEGADSVIFAGLLEIVACCEMCTNDGTKVCARCSVARYCSRTCQRNARNGWQMQNVRRERRWLRTQRGLRGAVC